MTIRIINTYYFLIIGLPILLALVAFRSLPNPNEAPQIRVLEFRDYQIKSNKRVLQKHNRTQYNINGAIIEYTEYETVSGNQSPALQQIHKYSNDGLLLGTMTYNENQALVKSIEKTYNAQKQIIKISDIDYQTPQETRYTTIEYDKNGLPSSFKTYDHKRHPISEKKKTYDEQEQLTNVFEWYYLDTINRQNKIIILTENSYDRRGNLETSVLQRHADKSKTKEIRQFENNALVSWTTFEDGKLISHFKHKKVDTFSIQREYLLPAPIQMPELEYDDDKRDPLQNIAHKALRTITIKSNKDGFPVKKVTREHQQVIEVIYYFYDDNSLLTKERIINKETQTSKEFQYTYDQHQNITTTRLFINDTLTEEKSYSYEYYYR